MNANTGAKTRRNPYLEMRLKTATSLELTAILYDVFIESLTSAADAADERRIEDRVRWTNRAMSALAEMRCSLDHEQGGSLATDLDRLYAYAMSRLTTAALGNTREEMWALIGLFEPLRQAWHEASTSNARQNREPAQQVAPELALAGMSA